MPQPFGRAPGAKARAKARPGVRSLKAASSLLHEAEFLVCSHFSMLGLALSAASLCLTLSLSPLSLYAPVF